MSAAAISEPSDVLPLRALPAEVVEAESPVQSDPCHDTSSPSSPPADRMPRNRRKALNLTWSTSMSGVNCGSDSSGI